MPDQPEPFRYTDPTDAFGHTLTVAHVDASTYEGPTIPVVSFGILVPERATDPENPVVYVPVAEVEDVVAAIRAASGVQPDTQPVAALPRVCIVCGHARHTEKCACGCEATAITDWSVRDARPGTTDYTRQREQAHAEGEHAFCGPECDAPDARPESCACDGQTLLQVHTAADCYDIEPARPVPDTERRKRYATPLFAIMRENGWDGVRSEQVDREMDMVVDAAIAVANTELRAQAFATARQLGDLARELSGVRAELEQARADLADQRKAKRTAAGSADRFRDVLSEALDHPDENPGDDVLVAELRERFGKTGPEPTRWRDFLTGAEAIRDQINATAAGSGGQAEDWAQSESTRQRRSCGRPERHPSHLFMRMEVVFRCPGTGTEPGPADEDGAQQK